MITFNTIMFFQDCTRYVFLFHQNAAVDTSDHRSKDILVDMLQEITMVSDQVLEDLQDLVLTAIESEHTLFVSVKVLRLFWGPLLCCKIQNKLYKGCHLCCDPVQTEEACIKSEQKPTELPMEGDQKTAPRSNLQTTIVKLTQCCSQLLCCRCASVVESP